MQNSHEGETNPGKKFRSGQCSFLFPPLHDELQSLLFNIEYFSRRAVRGASCIVCTRRSQLECTLPYVEVASGACFGCEESDAAAFLYASECVLAGNIHSRNQLFWPKQTRVCDPHPFTRTYADGSLL